MKANQLGQLGILSPPCRGAWLPRWAEPWRATKPAVLRGRGLQVLPEVWAHGAPCVLAPRVLSALQDNSFVG